MSSKPRLSLIITLLLAPCAVVCGQGLKGEYFTNTMLSGQPALTRTENVSFNWGAESPGSPIGTDSFSVRWTGSLTPPVTGEYTFATQTDDGVRLWVGGDSVVNNWTDHSSILNSGGPVLLEAGEPVPIRLEFYENGGDAVCQFYWAGPGFEQEIVPVDYLSPTTVQNLRARKPNPPDGTLDFSPGVPMLQWTAGETAASHNVYLGTSPDLTEADLAKKNTPLVSTFYYRPGGFTPGTWYYWRVDEVEKDLVTVHEGKVWSFFVQASIAYHPTPAVGATDVPLDPDLTWLPGIDAIEHQVYFSNRLDAVTEGTAEADKGVFAFVDANFAPDTLDVLTTYYWRVDEILEDDTIMPGEVWSFTTCLPVDDFENYTDNIDAGETLWHTWIDGLTNGTGSYVGYENANGGTFGEITIVHGGWQSMPIDYNNVGYPYYSEVEREFASAFDWTVEDANTLVLFVCGRLANAEAPLYVTLEDTSQKSATVIHPDPAISRAVVWTAWKIPLSEFTNVNSRKVKKIRIGIGDNTNPTQDGLGRVFIDDICVTKGAP